MNNNKTLVFFFLLLFSIFSVCALFSPVWAENSNIGFLLTDKNGEALLSENPNKPLIPASILKIVTSLAAISYLGEEYRYQTHFYYDFQSSNLFIKGFGDPLFISEKIKEACKLVSLRLQKKKINTINNIILDHSFFEGQITIPGKSDTLNPYDAFQGALCANFNTVFFKTDNTCNKFVSAEDQTPLLEVFKGKIIATNLQQGRITLSKRESQIYPGLLIKYFLEKEGVKVSGGVQSSEVQSGEIDTKKQLFLIYSSDIDLKEIIQNLLEYSNNFIANQILLTLGAHVSGPPSNLKNSISAVNSFLSSSFQNINIKYVEGSGISHKNRLSCKDMITILIKFKPWHNLLKKNNHGFYKTGTLSGIRTRAGYILGKNNSLYPYVIMINQRNKGYKNILKKMEGIVADL